MQLVSQNSFHQRKKQEMYKLLVRLRKGGGKEQSFI